MLFCLTEVLCFVTIRAKGVYNHGDYTCDECQQHPIKGMLWHCEDCFDYDICTQCYMADKHLLDHGFQRRVKPGDSFVSVGKRVGETKLELRGIFKDARVCRGKDWEWGAQDGGAGKEGRVVDIVPWGDVDRAGARVTWDFFWRTNNYRVGYAGKVDLKCVAASSGGTCYVNHLPKLGERPQPPRRETAQPPGREASADQSQINVGDRVVINLDEDLLRQTAEGHGGWCSGMEKVTNNFLCYIILYLVCI